MGAAYKAGGKLRNQRQSSARKTSVRRSLLREEERPLVKVSPQLPARRESAEERPHCRSVPASALNVRDICPSSWHDVSPHPLIWAPSEDTG